MLDTLDIVEVVSFMDVVVEIILEVVKILACSGQKQQ